jgi:splicing factor 45
MMLLLILTSSIKVLLLVNMVGPGQADDDLLEEVKEECASKNGPVKKCKIYEIEEKDIIPEEAVRIFVQFQEEKDFKKGFLIIIIEFQII